MKYFVVILFLVCSSNINAGWLNNEFCYSYIGNEQGYSRIMTYISIQAEDFGMIERKTPVDKMEFFSTGLGSLYENNSDMFFLYDFALIDLDVMLKNVHMGITCIDTKNANLMDNDTRWALVRLGYSDEIFNFGRSQLNFYFDGKIGGTSIVPGEKLYSEIINSPDEEFGGMETGFAGKMAYSIKNNWLIALDVDQRVIVSNSLLNISDVASEIHYYFNNNNELFSDYKLRAKLRIGYQIASANQKDVRVPSLSLACDWFYF